MLTRTIDSKVYGQTELEVARLPEGSFFGELPGLLDIATHFGLKACQSKRKGEFSEVNRNDILYCEYYILDVHVLRALCKDYPRFCNQIYVRGEVRTAHFKHLAMLRQGEFSYKMKVLEVEKQCITN